MKNYEAHEELIENFEKNSSELYRLALLLTGNTDRSVEAFSRAIDFDEEENPAFGGFMNAWARKLIIVKALGTIEKELRASKQRVARRVADEAAGVGKWKRRAHIAREEFEEAVIVIDAFPRCAMLLTIFEGMPIEDAAVLLNADKSLTASAQRIGIVELTRNLAGNGGRDPYPGMNPVPVLSLS
jgi:hypothetical protein